MLSADLLSPVGFAGELADLLQLVVGDRHRHEQHVVGPTLAVGVGDVGEEPELRGQELAGPRSAALDVELQARSRFSTR